MDVLSANAKYQRLITDLLVLKYPPIALKLIEEGQPVLQDAYIPIEHGEHIALCQAFALSRRNGKTVYMNKESHWCWNPLIAFGHVKCEEKGDPGFETLCKVAGVDDPEAAEKFVSSFMKLPYKKYNGLLISPLDKAEFEPDIVLVYCGNGQLRTLLMALRQSGELIKSEFYALDSCLFSIIPPLTTGEYRITLPDPGEYERALTDNNTIIFSIPAEKSDELQGYIKNLLDAGMNDLSFSQDMKADFSRPPFYNEVFEAWGLEKGIDWER